MQSLGLQAPPAHPALVTGEPLCLGCRATAGPGGSFGRAGKGRFLLAVGHLHGGEEPSELCALCIPAAAATVGGDQAGHRAHSWARWPWLLDLKWHQNIEWALGSWTAHPTEMPIVPAPSSFQVLWPEPFCST